MIRNVITGMDEGPCRYKYSGTGTRNPHVTLPPCTTLNIVVARNIVLCCTFSIGCYCCSYFVPYSNNLMDSFITISLPVCFEDGFDGPLLISSASEEALLQADFDTVNPHGSRVFCVIA
jgi:hypothetical protein